MVTVCGIDDAGRGPVIGPMIMVGILIDEKDLPKLKTLGVKDSKLLTPNQREKICKEIVKIVKDYKIIRIPIPGHTNDSVAFCVDKFLFVGDLIFAGSLGSGSFSYKKLLESFKKILSLNKDYFIFPGHGPSTTIEQERENNAFNNS